MVDQKFSILFWLNKGKINSSGCAPIWVRITIDGVRAECSTSKSIEPSQWDSKTSLPKRNYYLADTLKQYIRQLEVEITRHYNVLLSKGDYVTADEVKRSYKGELIECNRWFLEVFADYLKELDDRVTKKDLSQGRYDRFTYLKDKVNEFIVHKYKRNDIALKDLTLGFLEAFYNFLLGGMVQNTAMDYCKLIKQVGLYAAKLKYFQVSPFQHFKCRYKKTKRTFLEQGELDILMKKKLPVQRLEQIRDFYVFSCFTGFAYSDVKALTRDNVIKGRDGNIWIVKDRQKTESAENVPLLQVPLAILEKYKDHPYCEVNNKLFPIISSQHYNGYLKEIAAICGINKNLTTHTARHTFATTVTLCNDVPIETVQGLLGHGDIRTTQIYAKILDSKISKDMNALRKKLSAKDRKKSKRTAIDRPGANIAARPAIKKELDSKNLTSRKQKTTT